jgi:hypothetical protein
VFVPDFVEVARAAFVSFDCALAELIKPTLAPAAPAAAMPKKRRRLYFVFSDVFVSSLLNYRSDLNPARISPTNSSGCSQGAVTTVTNAKNAGVVFMKPPVVRADPIVRGFPAESS